MNSINNIVHPGQSKSGGATSSSASNTCLDGSCSTETEDSSVKPASFSESLKKELDTQSQSDVKVDAENNGNNLPLDEYSTELPAQDDRSLLSDSLNPAGLLPTENKPPVQNITMNLQLAPLERNADSQVEEELGQMSSPLPADPDTGDDAGVDGRLNMLLSQVRQLLRVEQSADGKGSQTTQLPTASAELKTTESVITTTSVQAAEALTLNAEQVELMANRNQALSNTVNQQSLPAIQTSLLQAVSAQGESGIDSLPIITNPMTQNTSSMNIPSLPQAEITQAFGRPAWSQGMGKQILWMVNQNISSAEIRLNPAHLGPIEILIDMKEEQVNVSLSSRHAIVREAMEQALPKLREMLSENGFNLADTDISKHSFAEQREQGTDNSNSRVKSHRNDHSTDVEMSDSAMPRASSISEGLVDYYI
jgi:flagellar hook-length control protein FliK